MPLSRLFRALNRAPCLFLLALLCLAEARAQTPACPSSRHDETVTIKRITDGDTLQLRDGRKLRLIGVNTPELNNRHHAAEPLAVEARQMLQTLAPPGTPLTLRWGAEKRDRYGRLLAHAFTPDGRNLSATLLAAGMGAGIHIPPNLWAIACYSRAENRARKQRLGIWKQAYFAPLDAHRLTNDNQGFHFIRGRLTRIGKSKSALWLNLGKHFALRIHKKDLPYFNAIHFDRLVGKSLTARGWIYRYKGQWRMNLHHPASLAFTPS